MCFETILVLDLAGMTDVVDHEPMAIFLEKTIVRIIAQGANNGIKVFEIIPITDSGYVKSWPVPFKKSITKAALESNG